MTIDGTTTFPYNGIDFDPILKEFYGIPIFSKRHLINIQGYDNHQKSEGIFKLKIEVTD